MTKSNSVGNKKNQLSRVLIVAGGTGGHVFPGLAVAEQLQAQGIEVDWLGTQKGIEKQKVPAAKIPLYCLRMSGVREGRMGLLTVPWRLFIAVWQAITIIRKLKPDLVLAMGGITSAPGGIAAWLTRTPLVLHEQNAIPGLTNRYLAWLATRICESFPATFKASSKVVFTGNPVRSSLQNLSNAEERLRQHLGPIRVLVIGGSQGALMLNQQIPISIAALPNQNVVTVWHQCGEKHYAVTKAAYDKNHVNVKLDTFIEDMASAYQWADIVICRAGAATVSELMAAGLGAILIPYPYAADDHQAKNAEYLVKAKAALMQRQSEGFNAEFTQLFTQIIARGRDYCIELAVAAQQHATLMASRDVATVCMEVCGNANSSQPRAIS